MANNVIKEVENNKKDVYTRLEDISEELNNYKRHFKNGAFKFGDIDTKS